jgi:cytochrome oxidase assembly protein ShyY1
LDKLRSLPYKFLFYFGITVVFIFLGLSYWQLNSYREDKSNLESLLDNSNKYVIELSEVNNYKQFDTITIYESLTTEKTWFLRSRVLNGQSGYNLINLVTNNDGNSLIVNRGWVPIESTLDQFVEKKYSDYTGKLLFYNEQTVGQDDIVGSDFLFRIDKSFLESEMNVKLPEYYLVLTENCGMKIECIDITQPYDAPHLSYSFQWLFFAICLTIVIFRKNKLI